MGSSKDCSDPANNGRQYDFLSVLMEVRGEDQLLPPRLKWTPGSWTKSREMRERTFLLFASGSGPVFLSQSPFVLMGLHALVTHRSAAEIVSCKRVFRGHIVCLTGMGVEGFGKGYLMEEREPGVDPRTDWHRAVALS